jgi:hypothetical protein
VSVGDSPTDTSPKATTYTYTDRGQKLRDPLSRVSGPLACSISLSKTTPGELCHSRHAAGRYTESALFGSGSQLILGRLIPPGLLRITEGATTGSRGISGPQPMRRTRRGHRTLPSRPTRNQISCACRGHLQDKVTSNQLCLVSDALSRLLRDLRHLPPRLTAAYVQWRDKLVRGAATLSAAGPHASNCTACCVVTHHVP